MEKAYLRSRRRFGFEITNEENVSGLCRGSCSVLGSGWDELSVARARNAVMKEL